MKNDLFVTAGEVAQDLGISKPFAYKLVRQMNEELEAKGFITIAGRVSRKYNETDGAAECDLSECGGRACRYG